MTTPLAGEKRNDIPTGCQSPTTREQDAVAHTEIAETAKDADIMMRMIVGSISPDPDDVRRNLVKNQDRPSASEADVNLHLVILAVALVTLVFAFDLVFLKM